ncbi:hypothetical protein [Mucilaginibacter sp.]|uniref:hypothetical protein n=1 Tax=Mucilaginibacter sp. TaxID=1882438 RepID=UPI00262C9940|nr:hypothetical protein [Mucilaginibacter sp.]MDB5032229.1 hypothetical protein [Mucilaginibacter sp.]
MESKFTKGVWSVVGKDLLHIKSDIQAMPLGQAFVQCNYKDHKTVLDAEAIANAKLFAAAPDLLEALQEFVNWIKQGDHDGSFIEDAEAALAKALD